MNEYIKIISENSLHNKYTKMYIQIINRAISRIEFNYNIKHMRKQANLLFEYTEGHHIWPQCFCSSDQKKDARNYAFLTAREHFICHWLLTKMFTIPHMRAKMERSFFTMSRNPTGKNKIVRQISSRMFEYARKAGQRAASFEFTHRQKTEGLTKGKTKYININTNEVRLFDVGIIPPDGWVTRNTNMVVVLDINTNEKKLVSKSDFETNDHYVGHSKGWVSVIDISTNEKKYIPACDYDRTIYNHANSGKYWNHTTDTLIKMKGWTTKRSISSGKCIRIHMDDPNYTSTDLINPGSKIFCVNGVNTINIISDYKTILTCKHISCIRKLQINDTLTINTKVQTTLNIIRVL
jgi:hypothetical protein